MENKEFKKECKELGGEFKDLKSYPQDSVSGICKINLYSSSKGILNLEVFNTDNTYSIKDIKKRAIDQITPSPDSEFLDSLQSDADELDEDIKDGTIKDEDTLYEYLDEKADDELSNPWVAGSALNSEMSEDTELNIYDDIRDTIRGYMKESLE